MLDTTLSGAAPIETAPHDTISRGDAVTRTATVPPPRTAPTTRTVTPTDPGTPPRTVAPPVAVARPPAPPLEERRGCLFALSQPPLMIFLTVIGILLMMGALHDLFLL
ncbi:hypothetical protein ACFVT5_34075 [Streptomyces sp. NPDC058001]|uniref:hypothetical protein n=1 Tax=Streptomyces sp. NPDC058001 TaxID=3346300 RepID=UPI0036ED9D05